MIMKINKSLLQWIPLLGIYFIIVYEHESYSIFQNDALVLLNAFWLGITSGIIIALILLIILP